jgi:cation diffusion facilitator CzcD-associated flavoprotein CzcO
MFDAIREGRASVETDHVGRFTEDGILLKSGKALEADVIITATGLNVVFNGEAEIYIDDKLAEPADSFGYKGMMYSGVPNLISVFGYTNASWTLRADLMSQFAVRLRRHMKEKGYNRVVPTPPEGMMKNPWLDFEAGYLQRVMDKLPAQGDRHPWLNIQDYKLDQTLMLEDPIDDGALVFSKTSQQAMAAE